MKRAQLAKLLSYIDVMVGNSTYFTGTTVDRERQELLAMADDAPAPKPEPFPTPWRVNSYTVAGNPSDPATFGDAPTRHALYCTGGLAPLGYAQSRQAADLIVAAVNGPAPSAATHGELELFRAAVRRLRDAQASYGGRVSNDPKWAMAVLQLYKLAGVES